MSNEEKAFTRNDSSDDTRTMDRDDDVFGDDATGNGDNLHLHRQQEHHQQDEEARQEQQAEGIKDDTASTSNDGNPCSDEKLFRQYPYLRYVLMATNDNNHEFVDEGASACTPGVVDTTLWARPTEEPSTNVAASLSSPRMEDRNNRIHGNSTDPSGNVRDDEWILDALDTQPQPFPYLSTPGAFSVQGPGSIQEPIENELPVAVRVDIAEILQQARRTILEQATAAIRVVPFERATSAVIDDDVSNNPRRRQRWNLSKYGFGTFLVALVVALWAVTTDRNNLDQVAIIHHLKGQAKNWRREQFFKSFVNALQLGNLTPNIPYREEFCADTKTPAGEATMASVLADQEAMDDLRIQAEQIIREANCYGTRTMETPTSMEDCKACAGAAAADFFTTRLNQEAKQALQRAIDYHCYLPIQLYGEEVIRQLRCTQNLTTAYFACENCVDDVTRHLSSLIDTKIIDETTGESYLARLFSRFRFKCVPELPAHALDILEGANCSQRVDVSTAPCLDCFTTFVNEFINNVTKVQDEEVVPAFSVINEIEGSRSLCPRNWSTSIDSCVSCSEPEALVSKLNFSRDTTINFLYKEFMNAAKSTCSTALYVQAKGASVEAGCYSGMDVAACLDCVDTSLKIFEDPDFGQSGWNLKDSAQKSCSSVLIQGLRHTLDTVNCSHLGLSNCVDCVANATSAFLQGLKEQYRNIVNTNSLIDAFLQYHARCFSVYQKGKDAVKAACGVVLLSSGNHGWHDHSNTELSFEKCTACVKRTLKTLNFGLESREKLELESHPIPEQPNIEFLCPLFASRRVRRYVEEQFKEPPSGMQPFEKLVWKLSHDCSIFFEKEVEQSFLASDCRFTKPSCSGCIRTTFNHHVGKLIMDNAAFVNSSDTMSEWVISDWIYRTC